MDSSSEILNEISHRRFNALRGSWVLVSPHRTKRPWQGQQEEPAENTLPEHDPKCYLCPGNSRAVGDTNPAYESTFVFTNDYSAVKEDQPDYASPPASDENDKSSLLLKAEGVKGKCFVICFSPKHNFCRTLADLSPQDIVPVIKTWASLYESLLPPKSPFSYVQIFENKGAAMGCSNPHPHGQTWATQGLPEEPTLELASLRKYREEHGGACLLCDYVKLEMSDSRKEERVVYDNDHFAALCPWWATWPFEILLLGKRHITSIVDLSEGETTALAEALSAVTIRYDNLFETQFPYSMGLHQAPLLDVEDGDRAGSHLHIHFYPPLLRSASVRKFLVGYEMMAEPQRDITPEQAAAKLRAVSGELYRKKLSS